MPPTVESIGILIPISCQDIIDAQINDLKQIPQTHSVQVSNPNDIVLSNTKARLNPATPWPTICNHMKVEWPSWLYGLSRSERRKKALGQSLL